MPQELPSKGTKKDKKKKKKKKKKPKKKEKKKKKFLAWELPYSARVAL